MDLATFLNNTMQLKVILQLTYLNIQYISKVSLKSVSLKLFGSTEGQSSCQVFGNAFQADGHHENLHFSNTVHSNGKLYSCLLTSHGSREKHSSLYIEQRHIQRSASHVNNENVTSSQLLMQAVRQCRRRRLVNYPQNIKPCSRSYHVQQFISHMMHWKYAVSLNNSD